MLRQCYAHCLELLQTFIEDRLPPLVARFPLLALVLKRSTELVYLLLEPLKLLHLLMHSVLCLFTFLWLSLTGPLECSANRLELLQTFVEDRLLLLTARIPSPALALKRSTELAHLLLKLLKLLHLCLHSPLRLFAFQL